MTSRLTITNHDRNSANLTYVYPVISRRAGGLSIGINVNINNACNWRCVYCQVPNLSKGAAPVIDFKLLSEELDYFIKAVLFGDFYDRFQVDVDQRVIKDIAISGNGEPTSAKDFLQLVTLVGERAIAHHLLPSIKLVLITNGSLIHQPQVQAGLTYWHSVGGEVWFKLDSATINGRQLINNTRQSDEQTLRNLRLCAEVCVTKIQTCLVDYAHHGWSADEQIAYLALLQQVQDLPKLKSVLLYTLARPSLQAEAPELQVIAPAVMQQLAMAIKQLGFEVSIH